eukprot:2606030-Lingulodinium_polyedra.AAC.1
MGQGAGFLLGVVHRVEWHEGVARLRVIPTRCHRFHPALQSPLVARDLPRDFSEIVDSAEDFFLDKHPPDAVVGDFGVGLLLLLDQSQPLENVPHQFRDY